VREITILEKSLKDAAIDCVALYGFHSRDIANAGISCVAKGKGAGHISRTDYAALSKQYAELSNNKRPGTGNT
jgi:hypothetical protein